MKILISENQLKSIIKEESGISREVRYWSDIIINLIKKTKKNKLILSGRAFPDVYSKFPIDYFHIENPDFYGAFYDENKSGYDEEGKYHVYIQLPFNDVNFSYLNHELRHAFEDYKIKSKGLGGLAKKKEGTLFFSGDFTDFVTGKIKGNLSPFREIITNLYFTSKIEQSAYSENVYDNSEAILDRIKLILTNSENVEKNYNENILDKRWEELKEKVNIPIIQKFSDYKSFLDWSTNYIKNRADKVYKKLMKVKYNRDKK
jgi:hypothetical protein